MKDIVELVQQRLSEEGAEGTEEELIALAQTYVEEAVAGKDDGELDDDQLDTVAGGFGLAVGGNFGPMSEEAAEEAVKGFFSSKASSGRGMKANTFKSGNFGGGWSPLK